MLPRQGRQLPPETLARALLGLIVGYRRLPRLEQGVALASAGVEGGLEVLGGGGGGGEGVDAGGQAGREVKGGLPTQVELKGFIISYFAT